MYGLYCHVLRQTTSQIIRSGCATHVKESERKLQRSFSILVFISAKNMNTSQKHEHEPVNH